MNRLLQHATRMANDEVVGLGSAHLLSNSPTPDSINGGWCGGVLKGRY